MTALEWSELWGDAARSMALRVAFIVANNPHHPYMESRMSPVAKRALAADRRRVDALVRHWRDERVAMRKRLAGIGAAYLEQGK